jgi:2',3'-cyclic-nucleotide 2'-phosphodiesterase (5'-nucleotidase family)
LLGVFPLNKMHFLSLGVIATLVASVVACEGDHSCYGPLSNDVVLTRNVRRMQPDAQNATNQPKAPLEWGQINFLHTTDTHGWLEGHIKEQNYGADWGDYVSFTKGMKKKARKLGVDLLLVDTGVRTCGPQSWKSGCKFICRCVPNPNNNAD